MAKKQQQKPQQDIWRVIPPEEKLDAMSRAHAAGVFACLIGLIITGTMAVSLKLSWLFWGCLVAVPFIFQFAAGKAWRGLRPRIMLEYLAARSAARRYAFTHNAKDLSLVMMFRGHLETEFGEDEIQEQLEASVESNLEAAVWIALFNDAVVMISERVGGARCNYAHIVNDKLNVQGSSDEGKSAYSSNRQVRLVKSDTRGMGAKRCKITSKHPAALVVFEKKLQALIAASVKGEAALIASAAAAEGLLEE